MPYGSVTDERSTIVAAVGLRRRAMFTTLRLQAARPTRMGKRLEGLSETGHIAKGSDA
jgi:hypothetical protein